MSLNLDTPAGLKILGTDYPGIEKILTKECLTLIAELEREFKRERLGVLQERLRKQCILLLKMLERVSIKTF